MSTLEVRAELVELRIPVPDRPGVLAEVTTLAGDLGVNITTREGRKLVNPNSGVILRANPDGTADSIHQNAAGVDLNRHYPAASWLPDDSYTYPPGTAWEARNRENRSLRSGPGPAP